MLREVRFLYSLAKKGDELQGKINDVDSFVKYTVVILLVTHIAYLCGFYFFGIYILQDFFIMQIFICASLYYFVFIKKILYNLATIFAHIVIMLTCCYCTYKLGWGYGFSVIIVLLLSLGYMQDIRSSTLPLVVGITEMILFFITFYFTKDTPNYPSPYMVYINILNSLGMFIVIVIYTKFYERQNIQILDDLNEQQNILRYKAENDYLTGLLNRRAMNIILEESSNKFKNSKINSFAIAIADIDNFKNINDTYGHNFGDVVLQNSANIFKQYLNKKNIYISRWGGEEFLIAFINYSFDDLKKMSENFVKNYSLYKHKDLKNNISATITLGVAFTQSIFNVDNMLTKADGALYNGKNNGKNQVIFVNI